MLSKIDIYSQIIASEKTCTIAYYNSTETHQCTINKFKLINYFNDEAFILATGEVDHNFWNFHINIRIQNSNPLYTILYNNLDIIINNVTINISAIGLVDILIDPNELSESMILKRRNKLYRFTRILLEDN